MYIKNDYWRLASGCAKVPQFTADQLKTKVNTLSRNRGGDGGGGINASN